MSIAALMPNLVSTSHAPGRTFVVKTASFPRQVRSEWHKVWSLRSTWVLLTVVVAVMGLIAALSTHMKFGPQVKGAVDAASAVDGLNRGVNFAVIILIAFACMMATSEYSTGAIRSTLTTQPRRGVVFAAKAAAAGIIAMVAGVLCEVVSYAVSWPFFARQYRIDVTQWANIRPMLGLVLFLLMWAVIAVAVGTLLRNTAVSIVVMLCWIFLIENFITIAPWPAVKAIVPYLPLGSSQLITQSDSTVHAMLSAGAKILPNPWEGYGIGCLWVVVLVIMATTAFRRREV